MHCGLWTVDYVKYSGYFLEVRKLFYNNVIMEFWCYYAEPNESEFIRKIKNKHIKYNE